MRHPFRFLFTLFIILIAIQSRLFSQDMQNQNRVDALEGPIALIYERSQLDYLLTINNIEPSVSLSVRYAEDLKTGRRGKLIKRSRLCLVSTTAFLSIYLFTKDKNQNLAAGSVVAALATSSLGLVYYIKAKKTK